MSGQPGDTCKYEHCWHAAPADELDWCCWCGLCRPYLHGPYDPARRTGEVGR